MTHMNEPFESGSNGENREQSEFEANVNDSVICIRPESSLWILILLAFVICLAGSVANFCIFHVAHHPESNLAKVLRRFDLGHEPSIPNFYSAIIILLAAGLLILIGKLERNKCRSEWIHWWLLALVFIALAVDEAVMIHEMIDAAIKSRVQTSGLLFFPWVIVGGIFALAFALLFIPFVARKSKRTLSLFTLAGSIFICGAIGMEMVAAVIFSAAGSEETGVQQVSHTIAQGFEELLEMTGIAIFVYALLDYLKSISPNIQFKLPDANDRNANNAG